MLTKLSVGQVNTKIVARIASAYCLGIVRTPGFLLVWKRKACECKCN